VIAVLSQAWEGVSLFLNRGAGAFEESRILEQPPTFGYAGLELVDFNGDGRMDFLTVNGDKGESLSPARPYHGVRLYLNEGSGKFHEAWFHPQPGAYKVLARDFDRDGDIDLASISFYPDYLNAPLSGFLYLENLGGTRFQAHTFPGAAQGRWITMDAGDLDGDGDDDLVLGSLVLGPETIPIPLPIREQWRQDGPAVLWLRNTLR
jgi:hypothetical protein